jgi:polysaccharide export outer membrane protein
MVLSGCGIQRDTNLFRDPVHEKYYRKGRREGLAVIRLKPTADSLRIYRYRLQPGDELRIRLLNLPAELGQSAFELKADERYIVNVDGYIHLPLAGRLYVQDRFTEEVRLRVQEAYSLYFPNPIVELTVTNLKVFLYGDSRRQGTGQSIILLPTERTHLIEGLALAGGIPYTSKAHKVKIIRGRLDDPQVIWVDMNRVAALRDEDLFLRSGDIIYLESRLMPTLLRETQPYLVLVNLLTIIPTFIILIRTVS